MSTRPDHFHAVIPSVILRSVSEFSHSAGADKVVESWQDERRSPTIGCPSDFPQKALPGREGRHRFGNYAPFAAVEMESGASISTASFFAQFQLTTTGEAV